MTQTTTLKLVGMGPLIMVDDDEIDIALVKRAYQRSKIENEFRAFDNGPSFLTHLEGYSAGDEAPSLVLLDINMPQMTGFEVLAAMRSIDRFAMVPAVLFLSHSDHPDDQQRAAGLGSRVQEKFFSLDSCADFLNSLIA